MTASNLLARLIGPPFLAMGAGLLFNYDLYQTMAQQFAQSYALIYFSGFVALLGGLAIVNFHNLWTWDWRVIITVLGWLSTVGGIVRIVAPQAVQTVAGKMLPHSTAMMIAGGLMAAFGAWLSYEGYLSGNSSTSRAKRRGRK